VSNVLLFILLGLGTGALYAGLAQSIVLTYRGSGTINMAAGAIAAVAAFVFFDLRTAGSLWLPPIPFAPHQIHLGAPWGTVPAVVVALAVAVLIGVLLELLVLRPLRHASPLARLVATLGVLLSLESVILLRFGSTAQISPAVLPTGSINMLGAGIPQDRFWLTGSCWRQRRC
jgi:branched-chain amino acid transport system permease protein